MDEFLITIFVAIAIPCLIFKKKKKTSYAVKISLASDILLNYTTNFTC